MHASRIPIVPNMKSWFCLGVCLLLLAPVTDTHATDYALPASQQGPGHFDFALQVSNTHIDLDYEGTSHDTQVERVAIHVFDTRSPTLEYGFIMGSSRVSVADDPYLAGIDLDGYHTGLALHSHLGRNPQLSLQGQYLYQEVSNVSGDQKSRLTWHEWQAGGRLSLRLGHSLVMSAGLEHKGIDASQRLQGDVSLTQPIKARGGSRYIAGLTLLVDNSGRVGLYLERGVTKGFELSFARGF
jgi:hypothetical protein